MTTKKERAEALARMTKSELIKTVKTLDARQVRLLNRIAVLEQRPTYSEVYSGKSQRMPWEAVLEGTKTL